MLLISCSRFIVFSLLGSLHHDLCAVGKRAVAPDLVFHGGVHGLGAHKNGLHALGAGVRAGAATAYQPSKAASGSFSSRTVETEGRARARSLPAMASARSLPERTCGAALATVSMAIWISPPINPIMACALPR